MSPILVAVIGAIAAALIVLGRRLSRLAAAALILRRQIAALETSAAAQPPDSRGNSGRSVIEIEILNPMELAVKQSALAGPLGGVTPGLLRKLVNRRASEIIAAQLREQGVQAVVRVHELS